MKNMKNTLIAMSCFILASSACASGPERATPRGTAGTTGTAAGAGGATGAAGVQGGAGTGAAGDQGTAGTTTTGAAGDQGGAGTGAAGDQGAAGTTGAAGDQGAAGTTGAAGTQGTAGTTGAAGDQGGAGTTGAAGSVAAMACSNGVVVSAGGMESNCTAKTTWKATAMPTPPSKYKGIADTQLQPQYAIDGMTTTRYSSGMTMAAGFYFQVDLGAAKMVSGITVDTSEGADTADVANGYEVGLSLDGKTFTPIASCLYAAAPMEIVNFKATMARYVRYTNKGAPGPSNGLTSWMAIHELDILCN
jgi:F5/8 type C domain